MPRIGVPELVIILVVVLVIFGAGKLPQIGGALGKSIHEFRRSARVEDEVAKGEPAPTGAGDAVAKSK